MPTTLRSAPVARVVIGEITPQIDGGRLPAKALVNESVGVAADVFADGHDRLRAMVRLRVGTGPWEERPLVLGDNDRWHGQIVARAVGPAEFQVVGWIDGIATWLHRTAAKLAAGQPVELELEAGARLLEHRARELGPGARRDLGRVAALLRDPGRSPADRLGTARTAPPVAELSQRVDRRSATVSATLPLWVERERAGVGAWYEFFPRSEGATETRGGTFRTAARRLPAIAAMGFDVVYLPPIHPIGVTGRKGPNNTQPARPGDPGSPWAIGSADGGHTAVHPELGTLEDFDGFCATARAAGLEVALDFALQCSPDHPWVGQHPDWFLRRPDGSVAHAENPPKRYEDIVPLDFACRDWQALWAACRDTLYFWATRGVRIFRVDNPHTKPVVFWAWLIRELRRDHPDVVLLAEAFTRPKMMWQLGRVGFSQSYTYFTWRSSKAELTAYFQELTERSVDFLRPNLFVTTPDILTAELQKGGRPAFALRLVLAATLSPLYGIYSGFELAEREPLRPGSEEYRDAEKYQYRPRDWGAPDSLAPLITQVNAIRRRHPALRRLRGLRFHPLDNPWLIAYSRRSDEGDDVLLMVDNLDPSNWHDGTVRLDLPALGLEPGAAFMVRDELDGATYRWTSAANYVRLDPAVSPAHILHLRR